MLFYARWLSLCTSTTDRPRAILLLLLLLLYIFVLPIAPFPIDHSLIEFLWQVVVLRPFALMEG